MAIQVIEERIAVRQREEDASFVQHFFAFSAVFFLLSSSHRLRTVNDLILRTALGLDNKGRVAQEVTLA